MQKDDVDLLKLDDALNRLAEIDEEIYGWFSEGFETGDLRDAKAFLNE